MVGSESDVREVEVGFIGEVGAGETMILEVEVEADEGVTPLGSSFLGEVDDSLSDADGVLNSPGFTRGVAWTLVISFALLQ